MGMKAVSFLRVSQIIQKHLLRSPLQLMKLRSYVSEWAYQEVALEGQRLEGGRETSAPVNAGESLHIEIPRKPMDHLFQHVQWTLPPSSASTSQ